MHLVKDIKEILKLVELCIDLNVVVELKLGLKLIECHHQIQFGVKIFIAGYS